MASRHLSRSIVLQSLYEWDFYDKKPALKDIVERNIKDFGPGLEELDFVRNLSTGIEKHINELDKIIEKAELSQKKPELLGLDMNRPCMRQEKSLESLKEMKPWAFSKIRDDDLTLSGDDSSDGDYSSDGEIS